MKRKLQAVGGSYFFFYFITYSGSALAAVSSFFMVEKLMGSIEALGIALAIKTAFLALASPALAKWLSKKSLAYGFWISQIFALISIFPLYFGLVQSQPVLFLFGILLGGIPNLILSLIGTTYFRLTSGKNLDDFKKNQGTLQFLIGVCFALVTFISPWFLNYFTYQQVLLIEVFTSIFGCLYIFRLRKTALQWDSYEPNPSDNSPPLKLLPSFPHFLNLSSILIFLAILITYILKGLPPMLAGSKQLTFSLNIDSISRQSFWFFEASAGIAAGLMYRHFYSSLEKLRIFEIGFFNGLWLLIILFYPNYYTIAGVIFILSTSITLTFMKLRDDAISQHATKEGALKTAGFISLVMNFTLTLSPLLIAFCTIWYGVVSSIVGVITFQVITYLLFYTLKDSSEKNSHFSKKIQSIASKTITGFLLLVCIFISIGLRFYEKNRAEKQMNIWIQNITKSIIPQLIISDFIPIFSKIELLQKTNLFQDFRIYDSEKELVAAIADKELGSGELLPIKDESGNLWGYYKYSPNVYYWWTSLSIILPSMLFVIILSGVVIRIFFFRKMNMEFVALETFIHALESYTEGAFTSFEKPKGQIIQNKQGSINELDRIQLVIENLVTQLQDRQRELFDKEIKSARSEEIARISTQVAHDIRSPLMALDSILSGLSQIPEEKRVVIRSSVARIRDIANNLIEKNREYRRGEKNELTSKSPAVSEPRTNELLSSLIDSLITEKRMQFRSRIEIEIYAKLDSSSYGIFANIQGIEFKRILSNLINNAVEAFHDSGTVIVSLSSENGNALVSVKDNGVGIEPQLLSTLGSDGVTHGKSEGLGLGLFHARTTIESWNGSLKIDSKKGVGTNVCLYLPLAESPFWFVPQIEINEGDTIVILDDDVSIHQIWKGRFESIHKHSLSLVHFSTPDEFSAWVNETNLERMGVVFLIDYELLGFRKNGLTLIEELGIQAHSILVTSRFEETNVLEGCKRLDVSLVPKGLAGLIPIHINPSLKRQDCILIDDDELIHMTWKARAKSSQKSISAFYTAAEFLEKAANFDKKTPIYIDSNLKNGIKGEEIAPEIYARGFHEIYLATGYHADQFKPQPSIRAIVGKEPPF